MIPQRSISLLSNRLAQGAQRRIRDDILERDYCLAWFLSGLAQSDLHGVLAFKGGTALKRCYYPDYRFSEDLDFTLLERVPFTEIQRRLESVYTAIRDEVGIMFKFNREDRETHVNSYTFYLEYTGPLPSPNDVKVDITIREQIVFPLQERSVLRGYEEFSDLPEGRTVQTYSLQEILTEKLMALADKARNEPRDLYDFWYLTSEAGIPLDGEVIGAIRQKLAFRDKPCEGLEDMVLSKEDRLERTWTNRLAYQMAALPPFEEIFRVVRRKLRQADLP